MADTMRDEYHFDYRKAEWGKFAGKVQRSKTVVYMDSDIAEVFPDSESVNAALRSLIDISKRAGAAKTKRKRQSAAPVAKAAKG